MHHIFFIHSSVDGHLGCIRVSAVVNSAAANIWVHVSFQGMVFSRHMPRHGIAGSDGNSQRRQWHPTPVLLPGKSHGRRSLVGCSPWGCEESDTTEQLHSFTHSAYPFCSISSQPRNRTGVSCIAGGFFTNSAMREVHISIYLKNKK